MRTRRSAGGKGKRRLHPPIGRQCVSLSLATFATFVASVRRASLSCLSISYTVLRSLSVHIFLFLFTFCQAGAEIRRADARRAAAS